MKSIFYISIVVAAMTVTGSAFADAGHAHKSGAGAAADDGHWMAPEAAAQRKNPVAADATSLARGKKLYQSYCASCHGVSGKGDGPAGAALKPRPADLSAMAGGHSDGDFAWKIENGRGAMPGWKSTLNASQIWDTVNFIQSMAPAKPPHDHSTHPH